jgi:hypothetical protein
VTGVAFSRVNSRNAALMAVASCYLRPYFQLKGIDIGNEPRIEIAASEGIIRFGVTRVTDGALDQRLAIFSRSRATTVTRRTTSTRTKFSKCFHKMIEADD